MNDSKRAVRQWGSCRRREIGVMIAARRNCAMVRDGKECRIMLSVSVCRRRGTAHHYIPGGVRGSWVLGLGGVGQ